MEDDSYYYIDQDFLQAYMGQNLDTNGVNAFKMMRGPMQDMIDQYCNRTWNFINPVDEYFDALQQQGEILISQNTFFIAKPKISQTVNDENYPLAKGIISVTIGTSPLDMNYVFSYDTFVKLSAAFPTVALPNPLGYKMVHVQYNSDAAQNPPQPVKLAFAQWMGRMIQTAQDSGKDATRTDAGTIKIYFKPDQGGDMPDFVKFVLNSYRLTPLDHM